MDEEERKRKNTLDISIDYVDKANDVYVVSFGNYLFETTFTLTKKEIERIIKELSKINEG